MKKFIKLEDNEDNTVTMEMCVNGDDVHKAIITMSMDDLLMAFVQNGGAGPSVEAFGEQLVSIPSDAEAVQ